MRQKVQLRVVAPDDAVARQALWSYTGDIVSRYYGRPATHDEVAAVLSNDPSDDLTLPTGLLVVALLDDTAVGCAGLRLSPEAAGEVKRVHVVPQLRGRGIGTLLMEEIERLARTHGRVVLRLDTRHDLVEARRMYARLGYLEVPAFNDAPYAEHWFAKVLRD